MEFHIFFKDDSDILNGPFTECEIQEFYRNGKFKGSFEFYFKNPSGSDFILLTLDSLRAHNGIGSPFVNVDIKKIHDLEKRIERENRIVRVEKVIIQLHEKMEDIRSLEKTIEQRLNGEMEELTALSDEKATHESVEKPADKVETTSNGMAIVRPESISDDDWQSYNKLGNTVADFVLDALSVYASGRLVDWDKSSVQFIEMALSQLKGKAAKGRNRVCEYVLVERMKEKEFFCCKMCMQGFFNYKQTLIHFTSREHCMKEPVQVRNTDLDSLRRVLNSFTKLPAKLEEEDTEIENNRLKTNSKIAKKKHAHRLRPARNFHREDYFKEWDFHIKMHFEQAQLPPESLVNTMKVFLIVTKSEYGRRLMTELDAHIGKAQTYCPVCTYHTGDREGFYAHYASSTHMKGIANCAKNTGMIAFDIDTTLINVLRSGRAKEEASAGDDRDKEVSKSAPSDSMSDKQTDRELFFDYTLQPDFIPVHYWRDVHMFGNSIANLLLNGFGMYASSAAWEAWPKDVMLDFESRIASVEDEEDRKWLNLICEHVLVEKMKVWEFFSCGLCMQPLFNYKQTLIHFTSKEHCQKETVEVFKSGVDGIRRLLKLITNLPEKLEQEDANRNQVKKFTAEKNPRLLIPKETFLNKLREEFDHQLKMYFKNGKLPSHACSHLDYSTEVQITVMKGEVGRNMMTELDEHIGHAQTYCRVCDIHTGDREGFYAHSVSSTHMKGIANCAKYTYPARFDAISTLINVHRSDLI